ncbi:MAG: hypothetical protein EPN36_00905 [Rhodanobacteraceae bacterium]|nr:MAG: hypothetical protein EPN36_00905 [Rhodanobacteraceae bacterium]
MRKFLFIAAIALLGTLGLSACQSSNQGQSTATTAKATKPTTADVDNAVKDCEAKHPKATADASGDNPCSRANVVAMVWQPYLQQIVEANMGTVTNTPYLYFVPAPENAPASGASAATAGTVAAASSAPAGKGKKAPSSVNLSNNPLVTNASAADDAISRVQDQLDTVVQATVLPGNMVAAGGPSSATTAMVLETAFKGAAPGSFKGVVVLFIGDQADEAAVKAALAPSGATFKFAQM